MYNESFKRNIGWITEWEQQLLCGKRVAIAGMGGVGGSHLLTLVRLGIGAFTIADFDHFERANFNRQMGSYVHTLGKDKATVLAEMAKAINPELAIRVFSEGVTEENIDRFLDGADLFIDGFDAFALAARSRVFARCAERGIPAITAGPIGMGTAYLIFLPGRMTFEEYFRLDGLAEEKQYVHWFLGLAPRGVHRGYLMDPSRLDVANKRAPSIGASCMMSAGVTGIEALKLLLGRGKIYAAPYYHQLDVYRETFVRGYLRGGNRHPLQRLKSYFASGYVTKLAQSARPDNTPPRATALERILDAARWTPSGDNSQPWRFQVIDKNKVFLHVPPPPDIGTS